MCIIHNYKIFRFSPKPLFLKIQGIIKTMTNQPEPQYESLAMKIFSDFCCNGCSCKSESDHNK